jgi:hypothetical protein
MNEERWQRLLREERRRAEDSLERYRAELAAMSEDPPSVGRHQADAATDLHEREDAEGRIAQLEERLAIVAQAEERLKERRYWTRVDAPAPPPPDLGAMDRLYQPER